MSLTITYRPLREWPGERAASRTESRFKATWNETLELLSYELDRIEARDVSLYLDLSAAQFRRDGHPHSDATPGSPGVVLEFEKPVRRNGRTEYVRASFPCDTYWDWRDNVRAIALTMKSLRDISRYGATQRDQQWAGWLALPGAGGVNTTAVQLSPERAAKILADAHPSLVGAQPMIRESMAASLLTMPPATALQFAKEARNAAHPDAGGTDGAFAAVKAAYDVFEKHRGGAS